MRHPNIYLICFLLSTMAKTGCLPDIPVDTCL